MDLVKARERAKKKEPKPGDQTSGQEPEPGKVTGPQTREPLPGPAAPSPSPEAPPAGEPGPGPEAPPAGPRAKAADQAPEKPPRKKKPSPPPEAATGKKAGPAPKPEPKPTPRPGAPKLGEDEVFTDDAFGEGLPVMEADDGYLDTLVLGEDQGSAPPPPGARPAKPGEPVLFMDDDMSWEVDPDEMMRVKGQAPDKSAARAAPSRKDPGPSPSPGKAPAEDRRPRTGARTTASPFAVQGWQVKEPAKETAPGPARAPAGKGRESSARIEMEWELPEPSWLKEGPAADEDDFYALVTEDLYLREFGRSQDEEMGQQLELLSFKLAQETYGVFLTSIQQIIRLTPITLMPRVPDYVLGIISLRGNIIPVFDLKRRLRLPPTPPTRKSRIIVVSENKYTVGVIVDEVQHVVRLPESEVEPPPTMLAGLEGDYILGIGRPAGKMLIILTLDKILVPVKSTAG